MRIKGSMRSGGAMIVALWMCAVSGGAAAQNRVYAYPNAGQSQEQQSRDRFECHQWAVSQSGFDPSTAPPVQAQASMPPPRGDYRDQPKKRGFLGLGDGGFFEGSGVVGDAATGAAIGAAGGAIAGDAGEGAVIGALASTAFGLLSNAGGQRREPEPRQGYDYYEQQRAAGEQQHLERLERVDAYNRAFGACMTSREYTVN